jgi:hypothetical protein
MTDESSGGSSRPTGKLSVQLPSDSLYLSPSLPIEVRDSSLRLVKRATGTSSMEVPVGLYEVSAVLGDGQRHSAFVNVTEGAATPVPLGQGQGEPLVTSSIDDPITTPTSGAAPEGVGPTKYARATWTEASASTPEQPETTSDLVDLELLAVTGATVVEQVRTRVVFASEPAIAAVPTALVRVGAYRQRISLPISPSTNTPSGGCTVVVERTTVGHHAQAWISPERRVANGLQNMLSTGYVLEAAQVADQAIDLLRGKYEDPAGAALGALALHKAGQLARWEDWVENLATDFAWLPDGKILLAALRVSDGRQSDRDLQLLLEASEQRVLYAETFSLLIDQLRRWPGERSMPDLKVAVERLTNDAPYIDRDAICLSVWVPADEA